MATFRSLQTIYIQRVVLKPVIIRVLFDATPVFLGGENIWVYTVTLTNFFVA